MRQTVLNWDFIALQDGTKVLTQLYAFKGYDNALFANANDENTNFQKVFGTESSKIYGIVKMVLRKFSTNF